MSEDSKTEMFDRAVRTGIAVREFVSAAVVQRVLPSDSSSSRNRFNFRLGFAIVLVDPTLYRSFTSILSLIYNNELFISL
jgi:hypothetical protein